MARKEYTGKGRGKVPGASNAASGNRRPSSGRRRWPVLLAILLAGTGLYLQTVSFDYAYDDKLVITGNRFTTQGLEGIPRILSTEFLVGFYGDQRNLLAGGRYRPLSLVTYALEWELFGRNPGVGHLINAVLYGFTGVVLFLVLARLFPEDPGRSWTRGVPLVATLLFVVHPLHSEVVANIKGRDELLSFLGALGALLLWLRYLDRGRTRDLAWAAAVFLLALLAKESAFMFLAVIPLTGWFFRRMPVRRIALALVPLAVVAAVWLGIRQAVIGSPQLDPVPELMNNPFLHATTGERFATIVYTMGLYLKLLVFPHPLTSDYYPLQIPIIGWSDPRALVSLAVYLGLGTAAVLGLRARTVASYSILVFLITFLPFSNLFFPIGTFMNERFMYAPSFGFAIVAASGVAALARRMRSPAALRSLGGLVLLVLLAFTAKTLVRSTAWKDDFTLFTTDVRTSSNSAKAAMSAGYAYYTRAAGLNTSEETEAWVDLAIPHLRRSIELYPGYLQPMDLLGACYAQIQDYASSIEAYEQCLKAGGPAARSSVRCWTSLEQVGDLCAYRNQPDLAVRAYRTLLRYDDGQASIHAKIGLVYGRDLGDHVASLRHLKRAAEIEPANPEILKDLGTAYGVSGDDARAAEVLSRAAELDPENPRIWFNLSAAYRSLGDTARAAEARARAVALDPSPGR